MIKIKIKRNFNYDFDKEVICLENNLNFNSFFILNDNTEIESAKLQKIVNAIQLYGYRVNMITMEEVSNKIINFLNINLIDNFDTIILLGEGGARFFNFFKNYSIFKNKKIVKLKWSRSWSRNSSNYFDTNIDEFKINGEKVIIFEDVIATGKTIMNIKDYLSNKGNEIILIITCLMQENSPMSNKNFCKTIVGSLINKYDSTDLDPFWYPPIYSLRHLMYGDGEMNRFYQNLNKKYFNSDRLVEKIIKKVR